MVRKRHVIKPMIAKFMATGTRNILRLKSAGLRSRWVM